MTDMTESADRGSAALIGSITAAAGLAAACLVPLVGPPGVRPFPRAR